MNREFLQAVTAEGGYYAIVGMTKGKLREQIFVETLDEVESTVAGLASNNRDIFFGLAKFATPKERTRANATQVKALWLDLDCGEGKPYETREDAIADLGRFCQEVKMPKPTIVNSGGGVHVYWPLEEAVPIDKWSRVAESLKAKCVQHDLKADPAVTADAARILRIPGTFNHKTDDPRPVEIILQGKPRRLEDLISRIGELLPPAPKTRRPMDAITRALMGNYINKFSTIKKKIDEGKGCLQIKHCIENQATLEEPMWRAALSVAAFCDDEETAIHEVSKDHPHYTPEATEEKASHIKGPYTCATFEKLRAGGCEGCPHRGNITSPIQIGAEIARATEADNEVIQKSEIFQEEITFKIPSLPFPYFRGKKGVVALPGKPMDALMAYIARSTKEMQMTQPSETASVRFGWSDEDDKFILGEREIDITGGMTFCPPSVVTRNTAPLLRKRGDIEKWKKVFNVYAEEGMEANAFGALCAFGAPLFKFTNHKGLLVNYVSKESGTGKSTILRMCNSVYGHPDKLMLHAEDTKLSRLHRFGVMAHLPVTIDEITNMKPEDFSDLAYAITLGRPRNRMQSQVNAERLNSTEWATIMLSSSNASFYEKMQQIKQLPEGELMRVFEIKVFGNNKMSKGQADEIFSLMYDNYGIAGEVYMRHVLPNLSSILEFLQKTQTQFDKEIAATTKERYWSSGVASILTGGHVAQQLGLHDYNLKRIYEWAADMVTYSRADVESLKLDHDMILADFIRGHINNILIIEDEIDKRLGMAKPPTREPQKELKIRHEPDTNYTYIPVEDLRNWCAQRQLYYKDLISDLKAKGIYVKAEKKRLGKGTEIPTPPSYCVVLDASRGHFIDVLEEPNATNSD